MSQSIFSDIDPTITSGTELATLLNEFKDAYASLNSGDTARPANLQAYGTWVKYNTPDDGLLTYYLYDGTQDIELFQINKSTANIILSNSEDTFNIIKNSDDSVGPDLGLKKGRIAGGGQTALNDVLGNVKWIGRDGSAVEYTMAKILSTATEGVTSGAHGSNIAFYVTQTGTSSLVKAVTISNEGKLGVGVDTPTQMVETFATDSTAGFKATIAEDSTTGPSMTLRKKRVTGSGQVLSGDTIGNFEHKSTDNAGAEISAANMKAVAAENHSSTQGGTNLVIQTVKAGATTLSDRITIASTGVTIAENLTVTGDLTVSGTSTISLPGSLGVAGDVTVTGDLTVNGTTTTINTATLDVEDTNITVNNGGTDGTSEGAGLTVERTGTDGSIIYADAAASKFKVGALGSEIEVADISSVQTLTNKTLSSPTIDSPSISTPSKLDVKKDTYANLVTYALTATSGQLCFATDKDAYYGVAGNKLVETGGGIGSSETMSLITGTDGVSEWDVTNITNATFELNTTTPLNGDSDFKFTNATSSLGEYVYTKNVDVPVKSRGKLVGVYLPTDYDGDAGDFSIQLYDVTNTELIGIKQSIPAGVARRVLVTAFTQESTAEIKAKISVDVENNGKILYIDDLEFTGKPLETVDIYNSSEWTAYAPTLVGFGSISADHFYWRRVGSSLEIQGIFTAGTPTATEAQIPLPTGLTVSSILTGSGSNSELVGTWERPDSARSNILALGGDTFLNVATSVATPLTPQNGNALTANGLIQSFYASVPIEGWSDTAEGVVHSGTFPENVFSAKIANNGTATISTQSSDFISSVSRTAQGEVLITWISGFFTVAPAVTAIAVSPSDTNWTRIETAADTTSVKVQCGDASAASDQDIYIVVQRQSTDYKPLTGTIITPITQTAYLKDVKAYNVEGGSSSADTVHTRTLNTVNEDGSDTNSGSSIVSLSSNQFTLGAGKLNIEWETPAHKTDLHFSILYNITTSTVVSIGGAENSGGSDGTTTKSRGKATITLTTPNVFEIRHWTLTASSSVGLGRAHGKSGYNSIYTQVKITKLLSN